MGVGDLFKLITRTAVQGTKNVIADPGRAFGRMALSQRVGLTAGYIGTGAVGNLLLNKFEENQRAYYGEERYNQYYGSGASTARGLVTAGAGLLAFGATIGRDPISRVISEGKYRTAQIRAGMLKSRYKASQLTSTARPLDIDATNLGQMEKALPGSVTGTPFRSSIVSEMSAGAPTSRVGSSFDQAFDRAYGTSSLYGGSRASVSPLPNMVAPGSMMGGSVQGTAFSSVSGKRLPKRMRHHAPNPERQLERQLRSNIKENVGFVEDTMIGTPYQGAIRTGPMSPGAPLGPDIRYNKFTQTSGTARGSYGYSKSATQEIMPRAVDQRKLGIPSVTMEQVEAATKTAQRLGKSPRLGLMYSMSAAALVTGTGASIAQLAVSKSAGLAVGSVAALGLGYAVHKAKGYAPAAIAGAAGYATYASSSVIRKNMTAEGTITDLSYMNSGGGVSKMNFSTAGLVQALHNANRKY